MTGMLNVSSSPFTLTHTCSMFLSFGDISTGLSFVPMNNATPPPLRSARSLLENLYPSMMYLHIRSLFTVPINASVTAMASIFSFRTKHLNQFILFRSLRALKSSILICFLGLESVIMGVLLDTSLWWRDYSDDVCKAIWLLFSGQFRWLLYLHRSSSLSNLMLR